MWTETDQCVHVVVQWKASVCHVCSFVLLYNIWYFKKTKHYVLGNILGVSLFVFLYYSSIKVAVQRDVTASSGPQLILTWDPGLGSPPQQGPPHNSSLGKEGRAQQCGCCRSFDFFMLSLFINHKIKSNCSFLLHRWLSFVTHFPAITFLVNTNW